MPVSNSMFEAARIYGKDEVIAESDVNMFKSTPIYDL
jgi:hypothetical protein